MFNGADSEQISMEDAKNRVKTGIPGFDELCGGGLVRDRTYLISGTSGAGKTNFGIQFIYNGIMEYGENGIIIATEERPEQIRENVSKFGWDLKKLEDEGKLVIIDACSTRIGVPSQEKYVDVRPFDIRSMLDQIISTQEQINAKRAVVDSTTSISFFLHDPAKIRVELLKLSTTMEILGLTSMMTCEVINESSPSRFGVENFVTDGTIMLYYDRHENIRLHSMEIYKMRGTDHSRKIHPYDITPKGFVIHPHQELYSMV